MIEPVVYGLNQGSGYICNEPDEINQILIEVPITINNKVIMPGNFTSLDDYLKRAIKYLGINGNMDKEMIFEIGKNEGLYYYQTINKVDEHRIFEMFSPRAGRDHIYKNNKWK